MVTITHDDLGEFHGDTEAEARKRLRAAQRKDRKERKRREAARAQAKLNAQANGFRIYQWIEQIRQGERAALPIAYPRHPGESCSTRVEAMGAGRGHRATYETAHGRFTFEHRGYYVHRVLEGNSGLALAVITLDPSADQHRLNVLAIGTHDDQIAFELLHLPADVLMGTKGAY